MAYTEPSTVATGQTITADLWNEQVRSNIEALKALIDALNASSGVYVGEVRAFAGFTLPSGWIPCNGQLISRTSYAALFGAIGELYGVGDGLTTFGVPNLSGRTIVGTGHGSGLSSRSLGDKFGLETVALLTVNMPPHTHGYADKSLGTYSVFAVPGGFSATVIGTATTNTDTQRTTGSAGSGTAHENMQPSLVLQYGIKV